MTSDLLFAAYLDGREVRWRAGYEREIARAGNDVKARLLALFTTCATISGKSAGPFSRRIVLRHERTLRDRVRGLAVEAGVSDPDALTEQLLALFRAGARPEAERLVESHLPAAFSASHRSRISALAGRSSSR